MARLAESLRRCGAEIEILSLNPNKHRGIPAGPLPIRAVDVDTSRLAGPFLHSLGGNTPWLVQRFASPAFDAELAALLRTPRDVVQVESPFLLPHLARIRRDSRARVALRSLNVEFRIWEGLARTERNPLRRIASRHIARSLRTYELREMAGLDAVVPITHDDADDFRALGCTVPMHVVPCGMPLSERARERPAEPRVGFLGSLDFRPNQQAVAWILDELWPRVRVGVPGARLLLAGSSPHPSLARRAQEAQVEFVGAVADAGVFLRSLTVFIAPLFAGGGMRIKVLEAMSHGLPIVATRLGAGGIAVEHDRDLLLAEQAEPFAAAVVRLLRDHATADRIGSAARTTVAAHYDPDTLGRGLLQFYESL